jgi:integrase
MPRKKLTDLFVERVAPPSKGRLEYFDTTFPALALRVTDTGHKSWSLFYRTAGRLRRYTIGNYPAFDPAAARKAASAALHRVEAGGDPAEEKRQRRFGPTPSADDFASVAREYLERQVKKNTADSTYKETARILEKDVIPEWGKRPIWTIVRRDVSSLIDKKAADGAEVQANRILARLRTLFGWAVEKDRIASNPCDGLRPPTKEKSRDRVLSDDEIKLFWGACDNLGWPFGPLFKLLLLTAQRRDEVASMEWEEIDLETGVWGIPKGKAKNGVGHEVQLSREAIEILSALPRIAGGLVFTTNGKTAVSGFSRAKERVDAIMIARAGRAIEPWILHDLRRTATTGMAALKIPPHVVDRILNHTSGTIRGVAAVYNRHQYGEERRDALAAWGRSIEAIVSGRPADNIVSLARGRGES